MQKQVRRSMMVLVVRVRARPVQVVEQEEAGNPLRLRQELVLRNSTVVILLLGTVQV